MICGLNRSDPVVRWDHSGESKQTTRGKLRLSGAAGAEMLLSDGTAAAVGMPVVAISGSRYGTYKAGDTGTICGLNPSDPVVRWDHRPVQTDDQGQAQGAALGNSGGGGGAQAADD